MLVVIGRWGGCGLMIPSCQLMLKYLRIAVTALSLTACVLLIALWVRSYWSRDLIARAVLGQTAAIHLRTMVDWHFLACHYTTKLAISASSRFDDYQSGSNEGYPPSLRVFSIDIIQRRTSLSFHTGFPF